MTFFAGDVLDAADLNNPPFALGIVAYGARPIASGNAGPITPATTSTVTGILRIDTITLTAGRRYKMESSDLRMDFGTVTDRGKFELRLNTSGTATTSSSVIARSEISVPTGGYDNDSFPHLVRIITPSSTTALASLLLTFLRPTGTGSITAFGGSDDEQIWIAVTDLGLAVTDTGVTIT